MAFSKPLNELRGHQRAVGVFSSRSDAEYALTELRDAGFNMNKVSVIAKDGDHYGDIAGAQTQEHVGNKADEGAAKGAVTGTVLGGLTGLLVGLGTLAIPGVGPILLAGEVASTLATAAVGAGIGAATGGLLGGLVGLGIPEERARVYSDRVSSGDYLVIVDGTDDDIRRAENILTGRGIQEFGIYNAPGVASNQTDYVEPVSSAPETIPKDQVVVVDRRTHTI
ncbi:general stress protein [Iningainema tapete]|uniref:DUF1269 domain-containing protein n=1 Tax=Iningainema tapete BLCC-T55 TaxID=2748662 RepID=A0A8J6XJ49_9CYAN|nr:general stress protein [Iningainema tapete]MBD2773396.1 DUF1269 domain-containing protein [Iningainema tapete BLCC-T55]